LAAPGKPVANTTTPGCSRPCAYPLLCKNTSADATSRSTRIFAGVSSAAAASASYSVVVPPSRAASDTSASATSSSVWAPDADSGGAPAGACTPAPAAAAAARTAGGGAATTPYSVSTLGCRSRTRACKARATGGVTSPSAMYSKSTGVPASVPAVGS